MYTIELNEINHSALIAEKSDNPLVFTNYTSYIEVSADVNRDNGAITEWRYRILNHPDDTLARWTSRPREYVSQESLDAATARLTNYCSFTERDYIRKGKSSKAWHALERTAIPVLQHYKDDLYYHDALRIGRNNLQRFVWLLRPTGTWLFTRFGTFEIAVLQQEKRNKESAIYYWDGNRLLTVTPDAAAGILQELDGTPACQLVFLSEIRSV